MNIRACEKRDAAALCAIYNYYIENTVITFEEVPLQESAMASRITLYTQSFPWFICEVDGVVVGYAYAIKWKERIAYQHSVEISVYIHHALGGKGYGKALYTALLDALTTLGVHVVIGGIALPNAASVGIHEYFGLTKVAHFPEVGFKFGGWIDVGYWQKVLDVRGQDVRGQSKNYDN
jgi:L-amino acid N-acyltransferase YncA